MEETVEFRKCKQCLTLMNINNFRTGRYKCKQCLTSIQNQKLREKKYFVMKYIEQKDDRLKYQKNYYDSVVKPRIQALKDSELQN